ncbi:hypothetical protein GQ464_001375 [Rhodocaloribacter litoris]|uniref:hypothetical protein n=1 Tax=Rhodocaloribacter litoris TaxID=2558931 RepID=UPI00141F21DA|nr:hypothetical protein [Rhodocaloribacter litoris]QXD15623.1 hypothetical protein GQ464_001375 [Rhodocaloribacter litoris]GIV61572.1 MAG: hypothetical protein KatS3mg044_0438 [Rhodothermaceae bacterium]
MNRIACGLVLVFLGGGLAACDTQRDEQEAFVAMAERSPEGFARTDAAGNILQDDPDDWRTAPFFAGKISFRPPYPNPTRGEPVTLPFVTLEFNAVSNRMVLRTRDPADPRRLLLLAEVNNAAETGGHEFRFSPIQIGVTGLHRLFVFDATGELVTYGDVMLEGGG